MAETTFTIMATDETTFRGMKQSRFNGYDPRIVFTNDDGYYVFPEQIVWMKREGK